MTHYIIGQPGVVYTDTWQGQIMCSSVGVVYSTAIINSSIAGFSPVQHSYPQKPFPLGGICRISSFFDAVRNGKIHHAEDVVYDKGSGGYTIPPYGAPVTAMEGGAVIAS